MNECTVVKNNTSRIVLQNCFVLCETSWMSAQVKWQTICQTDGHLVRIQFLLGYATFHDYFEKCVHSVPK